MRNCKPMQPVSKIAFVANKKREAMPPLFFAKMKFSYVGALSERPQIADTIRYCCVGTNSLSSTHLPGFPSIYRQISR